jgi:PAS domain S-box-containing protein
MYMRRTFPITAAHYGLAVLATLLALAVRWPLWQSLEFRSPFLTFFPAVVVTAYYGGLRPGLFCSLLSGFIATYFRVETRFWMRGEPIPAEVSGEAGQRWLSEMGQRWLSDVVSLIIFLVTCVVICRLIESLHNARRRLEGSKARARRLFESDVVGVIDWDLESGLVTDANDVFLRMTGYSRDELEDGGINWRALTPPEWAQLDQQELDDLRSGRKIAPSEREYVRKDGGRVPVIVGGALFDDSDREGVSFVLDISKRKSAELATESAVRRQGEALALLDALLDHAPVGFAFFDRAHRYVRVNDFLAAAARRPAMEHRGRHVRDLAPTSAALIEPLLDRVFRTGEPVQNLEVPGEYSEPGEERSWLTCLYPVHGDTGDVRWVGAVILDVTERKRLMAELRSRAEQLAENDRRKDEFLAMLSHELRNPLAPIRNAVHVLQTFDTGVEIGQAREVIERQVTHLARLVDDLLDVSRITRGKVALRPELVGLDEIVARAVETTRPLIETRSHKLTVEVAEDSPQLFADPTRMAQVVANLLNNAAKYTDEGGHISLRASREDNQAVVRVRDTGVGIPADILPHVFDLFTQAERTLDRAQGGLGIGLTLVKSLVEQHGGTVEAFSDGSGCGSEFVVRVPLRDAPKAVAAPVSPSKARISVSRRVLVVDDNGDAADTLAMVLSIRGYEVRVARDGPAALEESRIFNPELVLLDIGLPGMDGYAVARALRASPAGGTLRLVALTGYGRDEDRRRSAEAGFDDHIVKPIAPDELLQLLAAETSWSAAAGN